jgi:hypothetical protein
MPEEVLRAKRFELVDDNGTVRGGLEINESSTAYVHLRGANGTGGVRVATDANGTAIITLRDEQDRARGSLAYRDSTNTNAPGSLGLVFADAEGTTRVQIGISDRGDPNVTMYDQAGGEVATLSVAAGTTPALVLSDDQGRPRVGIAILSNGTPTITLLDEQGQSV